MPEGQEKAAETLAKALRPQQRVFVMEYIKDWNGTQAAIRAGYEPKRAAATASRLLRQPQIRAYRDALMRERFESIGVTKHNLAAELWGIYRKCCQKEPVLEWNPATRAWEPSGQWQFNVKGALKSLDMLRQMMPGMASDDEDAPSFEDGLDGGGREF